MQKQKMSKAISTKAQVVQFLAGGFSYPSKAESLHYASQEHFRAIESFLTSEPRLSSLTKNDLKRLEPFFEEGSNEKRAVHLRQEYTSLFLTPPLVADPHGARWVLAKSPIARKRGEAFAVSQYYFELGLCNKKGVSERADFIVSELDYTSYVLGFEAKALEQGDPKAAQDWRALRNEFMDNHLREFALNFSRCVGEETKSPYFVFLSSLLQTVVNGVL